MGAFEKYIEKLVNGEALSDLDDGFPKNESSWEELFDFGVKRIGEIVTLMRKSAQQSVYGFVALCKRRQHRYTNHVGGTTDLAPSRQL